MPADPNPQPVKPKGQPLQWGGEAVASLARIGPEDVTSARALWRRSVPKRMRRLIDAGRR